jgi:dihydroflavonol-4-reductase
MALALVTGGSGFVGAHLVEVLRSQGEQVRVLDIVEPDAPAEDVEFARGSVADPGSVEPALEGVDCVYHLAGIAHLWRRNADDFDLVNRRGTETVLRSAAAAGVRRIVHCSTESILLPKHRNGAVHIDESARPTVEDMPGPYTRSKLLGENAALKAAHEGLDVVVVNPTVPIGNDRNMTPPAAMLALFLSGGSPFYLDCVLNLVDVRDVAAGMVLAARHGRAGERYILGGENLWLRDLLPLLEEKSGRRMPRRVVPGALAAAVGRVAGWVADNVTHKPPVASREAIALALRSAPLDSSKARSELGYTPRPVDEALTEVVERFKREGTARR